MLNPTCLDYCCCLPWHYLCLMTSPSPPHYSSVTTPSTWHCLCHWWLPPDTASVTDDFHLPLSLMSSIWHCFCHWRLPPDTASVTDEFHLKLPLSLTTSTWHCLCHWDFHLTLPLFLTTPPSSFLQSLCHWRLTPDTAFVTDDFTWPSLYHWRLACDTASVTVVLMMYAVRSVTYLTAVSVTGSIHILIPFV